jgi:Flp pilus assembly protein TadB
MTRLQTAAVVAVLATTAGVCWMRALRPARRSVTSVRATLASPRSADAAASVAGPATPVSQRVGAPVAGWVVRRCGDQLALIGMTAEEVAARLVVAAVAGAFAVVLPVSALITLGMVPLSPLWLAVAAVVAAAATVVMWTDVTGRIDRRRREIRRATNDVVQLVAVGLTTDQSVEEAVHFALSVGDSEVFDLLRAEVAAAPARGLPVWEALDRLGRRFEQRELTELATAIERQGLQGVSITDSVLSLARAMRERSLDELERDADRANANLAGPTMCFVVTTIVFLAYPLAIRLGEAFAG